MFAPAAPASTVILLRPARASVEVLLVRRHHRSSFLGGAYVFPGGKVDLDDGIPGEDATFVAAGVRELREEAGVEVSPAALRPWSRWITPSIAPQRFDTLFFLAPLPPGQRARFDGKEATADMWTSPADALRAHADGTIDLPPPTYRNLFDMSKLRSVDHAMEVVAERVIAPLQPRVLAAEPVLLLLPHDPEYASAPGDGAPLPPRHPLATGFSRFARGADGRWMPA